MAYILTIVRLMKRNFHYNTVLNIGVLFLFAAVSIGFTSVFHQCRIKQEMACCAMPDRMPDECSRYSPAQHAPSVKTDQTCHVDVLVGGLQTTPAVSERQTRIELQRLPGVAVAHVTGEQTFGTVLQSSSILPTMVQARSASRDKTVLFSSFLI